MDTWFRFTQTTEHSSRDVLLKVSDVLRVVEMKNPVGIFIITPFETYKTETFDIDGFIHCVLGIENMVFDEFKGI